MDLFVLINAQDSPMNNRKLYSITEARHLLGGISRNSIYSLLRSGELQSVVIRCRRFISDIAIADLVQKSTTNESPSVDSARLRKPGQNELPLPLPATNKKSRKDGEPE